MLKWMAEGRDRLVILCLYDLGCRIVDLVTTRTSDIDFQNGFIRIESRVDEDQAIQGRQDEPDHLGGHQGEH